MSNKIRPVSLHGGPALPENEDASHSLPRLLSRRSVLRNALVVGAIVPGVGGLLAACTQAPAPTTPPEPPASVAPAAVTASAARPNATATPADAAVARSKPSASTKDSLVIGQSQDIISLDPTQHTTYPTQNVLWHIYEPLVTRGSTGKYEPLLAIGWKTLNDTTWQFALRQGVTFSNGEPFDASAVKFSFDRAMNPGTKTRSLANLRSIERVEVVDPYTVNFVTKGPYPVLLYYLSEAGFSSVVLPPKYAQDQGMDGLSRAPIGTGPYTFVNWKKDESVTLQANPGYWGGSPAIKKLTWRAIPEDAARLAELRSGGADLIDNVVPEQVDALKTTNTRVDSVASDFIMFVAMDTTRPGPLQDKRVRQALNYAVDVDAIATNILGGLAKRISVSLPADAFGYPADLQPYPYDPDMAKKLLTEAGVGGGFKIPFISRNGRYLKDKEIVEAIGGFLSQVGIDTDIQLVTGSVWSQISDKHERLGLSYPGWSGPDAELVWGQILKSGGLQSYVEDPHIDTLIEQGSSTLDQQKRQTTYADLAKLLKDEAVHIPLFQSPLIYASAAGLRWSPRGDSILDVRTATFA
ncbi:MAG: ABC transporter substrate-binding protein [Chloroflexota bacterium]